MSCTWKNEQEVNKLQVHKWTRTYMLSKFGFILLFNKMTGQSINTNIKLCIL